MNAQVHPGRDWPRHAGLRRLPGGQVWRLPAAAGQLTVTAGRVWLTRRGDRDDHVLETGQRMRLQGGEDALLEAWDSARGAVVSWQPEAQPRRRLLRPEGLDKAADAGAAGRRWRLALAGLLRPLSALARSAASMARRAQGRISAGDSIACGGTVQ